MTNLGTLLRNEHGLFSISEHLVKIVSHHDSVLLDQIVWDALGSESWAISQRCAFSTSHAMLASIARSLGIEGPTQILDLATELFGALGLGQLRFEAGAGGGRFLGDDLLQGSGFRARYGTDLRIKHSMDAFTAGFGSAAASVAFPSDWGAFAGEETSCLARGDTECSFRLSRRADALRANASVTRADAEELLTAEDDDEQPGTDAAARSAALAIILGAASDERGILRLRGPGDEPIETATRLALVPVGCRAELVFDAHALLEKRSPNLAPLFRTLVREATQASLLVTIAELEALCPSLEPATTGEARAARYASIGSSLGWGAFSVAEYASDRIVLRTPISPEAVYFTGRYGGAPGVELPGVQGMAGAIALLTFERDRLGRATFADYARLMASSPDLRIEETKSVVRGDAECEIVVTLRRWA